MKISAQALVFAGLVVSVTGLEASVRGENVSMTSSRIAALTQCHFLCYSFLVCVSFFLFLMTITINDYR